MYSSVFIRDKYIISTQTNKSMGYRYKIEKRVSTGQGQLEKNTDKTECLTVKTIPETEQQIGLRKEGRKIFAKGWKRTKDNFCAHPMKWVLVLGCFLKMLFIAYPSSCVFDEMHYSKFIGMYLRGEPVLDVHPPLGRLIMYGISRVFIRGTSEELVKAGETLRGIKIGDSYDSTCLRGVYIILRLCSVGASVYTLWIAHRTICLLGVSEVRAAIFTMLLIYESAMHSMFRLFMIDSYVLLSIGLILYSLIRIADIDQNTKQIINTTITRIFPYRPTLKERCTLMTLKSIYLQKPTVIESTLTNQITSNTTDNKNTIDILHHPIKSANMSSMSSISSMSSMSKSINTKDSINRKSTRVSSNRKTNEKQIRQSMPKEDTENIDYFNAYQSIKESIIHSLYWSGVLGISLGLGIGLKWSVLPVGVPIAYYLLQSLANGIYTIRSYRKKCHREIEYQKEKESNYPNTQKDSTKESKPSTRFSILVYLYGILPVLQGVIVLLVLASVYLSIFYVNHQINNNLDLSLANNQKPVRITENTLVSIKIIGEDRYWTAIDSTLALTNQKDSSWRITGIENSSNGLEYNKPMYLFHSSGLYLSFLSNTLLSDIPEPLIIKRHSQYNTITITNSTGEYLNLSEFPKAAWNSIPMELSILIDTSNSSNSSNSSNGSSNDRSNKSDDNSNILDRSIHSTIIPGKSYVLAYLSGIVQCNILMYQYNSLLKSNHQYNSRPMQWIIPFENIHMWSGGTSSVSQAEKKYGSGAQIFFMCNPLLLVLSVVSIIAYSVYSILKPVTTIHAYILILSYVSNYVTYFLLSRDTYLHHYIPSYYISIITLIYILCKIKYSITIIPLVISVFLIQYPISIGIPFRHSHCTILFRHSALINHFSPCDVYE
ncbi:hypothetical protein NEOKW01_1834 [Nematocida sp. AWRm80]|nr:hypothetical protein NEOKW01_1834 [Nematocida sp. AWRm80]